MDQTIGDMWFVIQVARDFSNALSGQPSKYAFGSHVDRLRLALEAYDTGHDAVEQQKRLFDEYDKALDVEQEGARWSMG